MANHPLRGPRPACGSWLVPSVPTCIPRSRRCFSSACRRANTTSCIDRTPSAWGERPHFGVACSELCIPRVSGPCSLSPAPDTWRTERHSEACTQLTFRHRPKQPASPPLPAALPDTSVLGGQQVLEASSSLLEGCPPWDGSPAGPTSRPGKSPSTWPTAGQVASAQPYVLQAAVQTQIQSVATSKSAQMKGIEGVTAHQRLQAGLCVRGSDQPPSELGRN